MTHFLVLQVQFARMKFKEGLRDLEAADAEKVLAPMNSISWTVGHLANFEQFWMLFRGGQVLEEGLQKFGFGEVASVPPYPETLAAFQRVVKEVDPILENLSEADLLEKPGSWHENRGTLLLRQSYHYWYHLGEVQAIRQLLGHENLPQFVSSYPDLYTWKG